MTLIFRTFVAALIFLPGAVYAENLCGVQDEAVLFERLAGDWRGQTFVNSVNQGTDDTRILSAEEADIVRLSIDGQLQTETTAIVMPGKPAAITLSQTPFYTVDQVDELLEVVGAGAFADMVSDTACGPEDLPQLVAPLVVRSDFNPDDPTNVLPTFNGQVVLIPYFDDRILRLDQLAINTGGTLIYMTVAALLTRVGS